MKESWMWGNDTPVWMEPRRTVYFIYRRTPQGVEYYRGKQGRVRTWRSAEAVKKALLAVAMTSNKDI